MPKPAAALLFALIVAACGAVPGGQGTNLPLPTPPAGVLARWSDFPATANPRPIIAFGDTVEYIPEAGFPDSDRKIAWMCNKFVLARGVTLPTTAMPGQISAAQAYAALMSARAATAGSSSGCTRLAPFVISSVRLAPAAFPTDRGDRDMPAWLFDVPEVNAYIGHLALQPSSLWGGGVTRDEGRGAQVSADGMTLRVGVTDAQAGPCGNDYTGIAAESATAVAVAVRRFPHASPGSPVACDLVMRGGYIDVHLKAPLGGRVLLDENGNVGAASA